ncbi:hypothetical protein ACN28E_32575 [Archangium lansingense]|uniref:hypothetical protein n=1 Tax=Archangium lansingense TaxID=2995310 RepID=UPI003B78E887
MTTSNSSDEPLAEVIALVRRGRPIDAIKLYRELTGEGLKESKEAIEQIAEGRIPRFSPREERESLSSGQRAELERMIVEGKKIDAIRLHRHFANSGLKEAKDAIEALEAKLREAGSLPEVTSRPRSPWRFLGWLLLALVAGVVVAVLSQRA